MRIRVEPNWHDAWVGVYWKRSYQPIPEWYRVTDLWICIIPMLPLHITVRRAI